MISAQTLRVCREGKPVPTFPDYALAAPQQRHHGDGRKQDSDEADQNGSDMVLRRRHRNLIAIARTNAFHLICPKPGRPPRRPRSRSPPVLAKFKSNLKLRPAFFGTVFFGLDTKT